MERLDVRDELAIDEACARCATPLVAPASVVRQDGELFCCASCARSAEGATGVIGQGCANCGAAIVDRATAVTADARVYCCANCAVAPREIEPPVR
ncbi:MAG TPA: hypothetical protein VJP45_04455 [Candidatus Limnocylindria bacterium]|nr:hypothetical protein [Candidatus Limnocylindria bacterium]